jgi:hypothetical protein
MPFDDLVGGQRQYDRPTGPGGLLGGQAVTQAGAAPSMPMLMVGCVMRVVGLERVIVGANRGERAGAIRRLSSASGGQ